MVALGLKWMGIVVPCGRQANVPEGRERMPVRVKPTRWKTRVVIAAMVLYAVCNMITVRSQLLEAEAYRAELAEQATRLQAENTALEQEIAMAEDAAVIEAIARTKLGLVRPGEKIFCDASMTSGKEK